MADEDTQAAKPEPEPRVRGISERDYKAWRHHPVTKLLRKFMLEYRADLLATALEAWEHRPLDTATDNEMRVRAKQLKELAELPFDAILTFFAQSNERASQQNNTVTQQDDEEDDEDDEAKTD